MGPGRCRRRPLRAELAGSCCSQRQTLAGNQGCQVWRGGIQDHSSAQGVMTSGLGQPCDALPQGAWSGGARGRKGAAWSARVWGCAGTQGHGRPWGAWDAGRGGREGMGRRRQVYVCDRAGPPAPRPPWRPRRGSALLDRVASPGGRSATGPSPSTGQARPACTPPSFSLHASGFPWGTVGTPAPQPPLPHGPPRTAHCLLSARISSRISAKTETVSSLYLVR